MEDDLRTALRLAGFALAHAVWSVEDGETLVPLAMVEVDGENELVRYEFPDNRQAVEVAREDLDQRLKDGGVAALVMDTYVTNEDGQRTDALVVQIFGVAGRPLGTIGQPYQRARRSRIPFVGRSSGFALLGDPEAYDDVTVANAERFILEGAREHPQAAHYFGEKNRRSCVGGGGPLGRNRTPPPFV